MVSSSCDAQTHAREDYTSTQGSNPFKAYKDGKYIFPNDEVRINLA